MRGVFQVLVGVCRRPVSTFKTLGSGPSGGAAFVAMALAAFGLSLLDLILYAAGHQPSMAKGPVDPINGLPVASYYLYQAAFAPFVFALGWLIYGGVALGLLGLIGARPSPRGMMSALGLSLGLPVFVLYVVPDCLVYGLGGFTALGQFLPYYAPLCLLACLGYGTLALRYVGGVGWVRAALIALIAFLIQSIPLGLFLR